MVEKSKIKESELDSVLDSIGCACGSCDDNHKHEHEHDEKTQIKSDDVLSALDSIACGCGSCEDDSEDHHHDSEVLSSLDSIGCACGSCDEHLHEHQKEEINDATNKYKKSFKSILFKNTELFISFAFFFFAIFTPFSRSVDLALFLVAYVLIARDVIKSAVKNVLKGQMLDENFLMSIASIVAFIIGEYAEGVAVMLFYRVGQLTEDYALNRSKNSIAELLDLKPDFANVKTLTGTRKVSPDEVKVNDVLVVKPGEKIPLDGLVLTGTSDVNTAMLTGESLPVSVKENSEVYSGTINLSGVLEVKVLRNFANSAVSKILNMVKKAGENKAKTEKFITRFAKVYTPLVVVFAALIALIPPMFFQQSFETWVYRGAIFLVVSCPCALVISVPLGYFGGIGGAARHGILVKGGHYLESLKDATIMVFDKTGTLTKGNFIIEAVEAFGVTEDDMIRKASLLESFSNHPIAKAVADYYKGDLKTDVVSNIEELAGKGIKGSIDGQTILIGNDALMNDFNVAFDKSSYEGTVLYVAEEGTLIGRLNISDEIKSETRQGLEELRQLGIKKFVMLTGDRKPIATKVATSLGIDEVHAELLPENKLEVLEGLLSEDEKVVFIGDGINDAPVIRRSDVGIAMGALGSDVAIESSDIVLMHDEITSVSKGMKLAKFTSNIIWQNIILALGIKVIIMILGTMGIANLWTAVFGDVGVAFMAILNSGRAIYGKSE
jgi:Cd2+/Zn2+-exporting ATPase